MKELLDTLLYEKETVEQLVEIDNDIMNTKYTYDGYYDGIKKLFDKDVENINLNSNSLFVTEGDVLLTLDILRRLEKTRKKVVIFINQNYVGLNKWVMKKFYEITDNYNVELDTSNNYDEYIDDGYKVIPVGEDALVSQVLEDFYGNL